MGSAMLVMTGRITMLGLSRWAGTGGRYRTMQRFVSTGIPWATLLGVCLRHHVSRPEDVSLVGGAAVGATKAGTPTPGRERFCASLYGQPVPGLACCTLSLVSTQARRAFPLRVEQGVRNDAAQAASQAKAAAKQQTPSTAKRRPGRPKGSTHTPKADVPRTPECWRLTGWLEAWRHLLAGVVPLTALVLAGHCGNHNALPMARQSPLPLLATRRCDVALSFPSTGP